MTETLKIWAARFLVLAFFIAIMLPLMTAGSSIITQYQSLSDAKFRFQKTEQSNVKEEMRLDALQVRLTEDMNTQKLLSQSTGQAQAELQALIREMVEASGGQLENILMNTSEIGSEDASLETLSAEVRWTGSEEAWLSFLQRSAAPDSGLQLDTLNIQKRGGSNAALLIRLRAVALQDKRSSS